MIKRQVIELYFFLYIILFTLRFPVSLNISRPYLNQFHIHIGSEIYVFHCFKKNALAKKNDYRIIIINFSHCGLDFICALCFRRVSVGFVDYVIFIMSKFVPQKLVIIMLESTDSIGHPLWVEVTLLWELIRGNGRMNSPLPVTDPIQKIYIKIGMNFQPPPGRPYLATIH